MPASNIFERRQLPRAAIQSIIINAISLAFGVIIVSYYHRRGTGCCLLYCRVGIQFDKRRATW